MVFPDPDGPDTRRSIPRRLDVLEFMVIDDVFS